MATIDILMITHRWPSYVAQSLPQLLDTATPETRVWVWHNGQDAETLSVVKNHLAHPRVHAFHHSENNQGLRAPTNWLWRNATGDYFSKVDDDCIVSPGWIETLADAHSAEPRFGAIGSWRFYPEDFQKESAERKIDSFSGGHRLLKNPWIQGSGYLLKRQVVDRLGLLRNEQSFTAFLIDAAVLGYVNGWYYPFLHEEHLDDPRSELTGLRTDDHLRDRMPLSARHRGIDTLPAWEQQMRTSALRLQEASPDVRDHTRLRRRLYARGRVLVRQLGRGVRHSLVRVI